MKGTVVKTGRPEEVTSGRHDAPFMWESLSYGIIYRDVFVSFSRLQGSGFRVRVSGFTFRSQVEGLGLKMSIQVQGPGCDKQEDRKR